MPLTDSNLNMIDANELSSMKSGAYLINVARGGLVDEAALAEALLNEVIAGAAIDVFVEEPPGASDPLFKVQEDKILLSPHIAGVSPESGRRIMIGVDGKHRTRARRTRIRFTSSTHSIRESHMADPVARRKETASLEANNKDLQTIKEERTMIGAEFLLQTAAERGVEVCFANPGTTEMPMVEALDGAPKIRPILGLFEGVCTGAADGYGRMAEKPAMSLLHLGPGLANGLCNLHNARRAHTPVLVVVGEHATWHRPYDPPLAMDIEALAGALDGWRRTTSRAQSLGVDVSDALAAARRGQVATLIVPFDLQTKPVVAQPTPEAPSPSRTVDEQAITNAARLLQRGKKAVIVLGGRSLSREGQMKAACIKAACGCDLIAETFPARMERGVGLPRIDRVPYVPAVAQNLLDSYEAVVFAAPGARHFLRLQGYAP